MRHLLTAGLLVALIALSCSSGSDAVQIEELNVQVEELERLAELRTPTTTQAPTTTRAPTTTVVRGSWEREIIRDQMDDSVETRLSITSRRDVIAFFLNPEPKLIIFCSTDHPLPWLAFQSHTLFQIDLRDVLDDTLFTDSRNYATELRIRFDNEDAYTLVTERPADSLFVTYFRNSLALIREMTKHDTLLVEFNDGEAVDSFDLRGLSYQLSAYGSDCGF